MTARLETKIQQFYDQSSPLWEQIWGEHMHHGYYGPQGQLPKQRRRAQIDLINELLDWSAVNAENPPQQILDVGCGIGGSSLYLAARFGAAVTGITLSPVQAQRATERASEAGFGPQVSFQVANALQMPFANESFDLVWSLESGEHMPDKRQFLTECCRVLKPSGRLILATWCHRPTQTLAFGAADGPATPLTPGEEQLLQQIYQVYCLPYVISLPEYRAIAETLPLEKLQTADWSVAVAPFWDVVMDSALNPQALWGILTAGWSTIQGALALRLMAEGYRQGLIRYGLLTGTKLSCN